MPQIKVVSNALTDEHEIYKVESGTNLHEWLCSQSPEYKKNHATQENRRSITLTIDDVESFYPFDNVSVTSDITITVNPKEPLSILIAIVSLASSVYAYTSIPDVTQANTIPDGSSIYALNAQGNRPKLGSVVPIIAGRHKYPADIITDTWSEFVDNIEYVYMGFSRGLGKYVIQDRLIGNTPFETYGSDIEYEDYDPGQDVTANDHKATRNMYTSKEVGSTSGQAGIKIKVEQTNEYNAAPTGQKTGTCWLNFLRRGGTVRFDNDGNRQVVNITVLIEFRDVNETTWRSQTVQFSGSTVDDQGDTIAVQVGDIEPVFRVTRLTAEADDTKIRDSVEWVGLRSELPSASSYPYSTTFLKIKSTDTLADAVKNKFFWLQTLKTPILENGSWTADDRPNRDIAPLIRWITLQAGYTVDNIDDEALQNAHAYWKGQNIKFDAVIDQDGTFKDGLARIMAVGHGSFTDSFGKIKPVIDQKRTTLDGVYTPDVFVGAIRKSSTFASSDEPNGFLVEYTDPETWKSSNVLCLLPHHDPLLPSKAIKAWGITDKNQAYRWGMRKAAELYYRRNSYSMATELDGWVSDYLDYVAIPASDNTQFGNIKSLAGNALSLSHEVSGTGQGYSICIRKQDGKFGALSTGTVSANRKTFTVDNALGFTPDFSNGEKPYYLIGKDDDFITDVSVLSVTPRNSGTTIKARQYSDSVYQYDLADLTPANVATITINGNNPFIMPINGTYTDQGATASDSNGNPVTVITSSGVNPNTAGTYQVTYAASLEGITYYSQRVVIVTSESTAPGTVVTDLSVSGQFVGDKLNIEWNKLQGIGSYKLQLLDSNTTTLKHEIITPDSTYTYSSEQAISDGIGRIIEIRVYTLDEAGNPSATFSTVTVSNAQVAKPSGFDVTAFTSRILVSFSALPTNVDDYQGYFVYSSKIQGFTPLPANLVSSSTNSQSVFDVDNGDTYYLRIAHYDVWGSDQLIFSDEIQIVAGSLQQVSVGQPEVVATQLDGLVVDFNNIRDDAIRAGHYFPGSVSAESLAIGSSPNLLSNSSFDAGLENWKVTTSSQTFTSGVDLSNDWKLSGGHTAWVRHSDQNSTGYTDLFAVNPEGVTGSTLFPVSAGQNYQFSAYIGIQRCRATLYIGFKDINGAALSSPSSSTSLSQADGGKSLEEYVRKDIIATAPAGAVSAQVFIRKLPTEPTGQTDSYLFASHPFFGEALPNQTEPSAYGEGGYTVIKDGVVTTAKIKALNITTALLAVGAVVADKISVASLSAIKSNLGEVIAGILRNATNTFRINLDATGTGYLMFLRDTGGNFKVWMKANGDAYFGGHLHAETFSSTDAVIDTLHVKDRAITDSMFVIAPGSSVSGTQLITATFDFKSTSALIILAYKSTGTVFFDADSGSSSYSVSNIGIYRDNILQRTVGCSLSDGTTGQGSVMIQNDSIGVHTWSAKLTNYSDSNGGLGGVTDLTLSIFEGLK